MPRSLYSLLFALSALVPSAAQEQTPAQTPSQGKRLSPELLWQLKRVSEPRLHPLGKQLLFSVRSYDLPANKGNTQIFLLDLDSGEKRQLTREGSNWSAHWSPDGQSMAFLSTRSGSPQAYILSIPEGDAAEPEIKQVTRREGGVANIAWSPNGQELSFTATVKLDQDIHDLYPDLPHAEALVYDDLMIRHWDHWKDGTYSHLFVIPVAGGKARDLLAKQRVDTPLAPFGGAEQIAWAPGGEEICYTAKIDDAPEDSTNSDLFVHNFASGEVRNLTKGMMGYDMDPVYSPDGKWLAFHSMQRAGFESDRNRLMLYDRKAGKMHELCQNFDQSVLGACWAADSQSLLFTSDLIGSRHLYRVGLDGKPNVVSQGRGHFSSQTVSASGDVYCLRMQTERPNEIVRMPSGEVVSHENDELFGDLALPKVEERWIEATDGKSIHSWVVYPPDFDPQKKYPMLLYCQGGPQQQVGQWFSFRWNFHLMAAQGYIVLGVNRRGLPGFGQQWNDDISGDWGGQAMRDLTSATDAMFKESFVDRQRTAAIGASYGGYTVYWLMGHDQENRFCSMIAHCGVFNLEAMYLSTEELFFPNWDLGGAFWRSDKLQSDFDRNSPHKFLQNWQTPLMVIHGQKDFRVPVTQGIQAFTAAQVQGVPSRFVYYPKESHWVLSPQNGVLWHRLFFDWLDRYCKEPQK